MSNEDAPKKSPKLHNPWTTLDERQVYDNDWIAVNEFDVINPAGTKGIYGKVHFKNKAVAIVPLDKFHNTWLVGQYRYPLGEYSWEIPEGGCPIGTPLLDSARRELKEETGITAKSWHLVTRVHTSNSVTDEEGFIFLAEDLEYGSSELEDTEADLIVRKLPFREAVELVMNGEITDSLSIAGILKVARIKGF